MSIFKPLIREAVQIAMKDFFDNYFTKGLIALIVILNGVALLFKVSMADLSEFNTLAFGLAGLNAGKSVLTDFADAYKAKHSQPKP